MDLLKIKNWIWNTTLQAHPCAPSPKSHAQKPKFTQMQIQTYFKRSSFNFLEISFKLNKKERMKIIDSLSKFIENKGIYLNKGWQFFFFWKIMARAVWMPSKDSNFTLTQRSTFDVLKFVYFLFLYFIKFIKILHLPWFVVNWWNLWHDKKKRIIFDELVTDLKMTKDFWVKKKEVFYFSNEMREKLISIFYNNNNKAEKKI